MPARVLVPAISKQIETAALVIDHPSHQPRLVERAHLCGYWVQGDVGESRSAIAPDSLAGESFQRHLQALVRKRHQCSETHTIAFARIGAAARGGSCGDSIAE